MGLIRAGPRGAGAQAGKKTLEAMKKAAKLSVGSPGAASRRRSRGDEHASDLAAECAEVSFTVEAREAPQGTTGDVEGGTTGGDGGAMDETGGATNETGDTDSATTAEPESDADSSGCSCRAAGTLSSQRWGSSWLADAADA